MPKSSSKPLSDAQQEQICYLAVPKCIPARTLANAKSALAEGACYRVKATVALDGTIYREESSEAVADSGPLKTALLAELMRDIPDETLKRYRRRAVKTVREAIEKKTTVNKLLDVRDQRHAEIMADLDAEAAAELPMKLRSGAIKMRDTESWIESASAWPADDDG